MLLLNKYNIIIIFKNQIESNSNYSLLTCGWMFITTLFQNDFTDIEIGTNVELR